MNQPSGFDASIPVLTEVLNDIGAEPVPAAAPARSWTPPPAPPPYHNNPLENEFLYAPVPALQFEEPPAPPVPSAPAPAPASAAPAPASVATTPPATTTPDYMHTAIPAAAYGAAAAALHDRGAQLEADASARWSEHDWQTMETRLGERILHQLQGNIDFALDQRIKDSVFEVVSRSLEQLSNEIRAGVQQSVEKAVARAVAQELNQLRNQKQRY